MNRNIRKVSGAAWFVWVLAGVAENIVSNGRAWSLATTPEKVLAVVFLVAGAYLFWNIAGASARAVYPLSRPKAGGSSSDAAAVFFAVFVVVVFEAYWHARSILPEAGFLSAIRVGALAGSILLGLAIGLLIAGLALKLGRGREESPAGGVFPRFAAAAVVFAVLFYAIFIARGWDFHLFGKSPERPQAGLPNVVIVTIDTLSANYAHIYGYPMRNTPNLEKLAGEGVRFDRMLCQVPSTGPSHATIMTGLFPRVHGVLSNGHVLAPEFNTLAEILREKGYTTAQFVNFFGCGVQTGLHQGFDVAYLRDENQSPVQTLATGPAVFSAGKRAWQKLQRVRFKANPSEENFRVFEEWFSKKKREPYFLWYHTYIPHVPYDPPPDVRAALGIESSDRLGSRESTAIFREQRELPPGRVAEIRELYAGEIAHADRMAARLAGRLREAGQLDRTLLIVASDHGEAVYEHQKFIGHTRQLYGSIAHVPCVIRFPAGKFAGGRIGTTTRLADLMPTVLDALGLQAPGKLDGESLMPLINGDAAGYAARERAAIIETFPPEGGSHKISAIQGRWQYIFDFGKPRREELFDMEADPFAERNIIGDEKNGRVLESLKESIAEWNAAYPLPTAQLAAGAAKLDKKTRKILKDLGYIR
ncbi:MAG: sulfatase [bacterium]